MSSKDFEVLYSLWREVFCENPNTKDLELSESWNAFFFKTCKHSGQEVLTYAIGLWSYHVCEIAHQRNQLLPTCIQQIQLLLEKLTQECESYLMSLLYSLLAYIYPYVCYHSFIHSLIH